MAILYVYNYWATCKFRRSPWISTHMLMLEVIISPNHYIRRVCSSSQVNVSTRGKSKVPGARHKHP